VKTFEKNGARLEILRDLTEASARAAELFTQIAVSSAQVRGRFSVALSGGSTPKALYRLLADDAQQKSLSSIWPLTHVFWVDERCVSPGDPESNYRMASETLLAHIPVPSAQVYRMRGEDDPPHAAQDYAALLETVLGASEPVFDLILLGMGADAHTASLFPHSPLLKTLDNTQLVAAPFVEKLNAFRLTMTLRVLNRAAHTVFLVAGRDKAEPLRKVFASVEKDAELPARWVRPSGGELVWLVDTDAARLLV
jgi:6-phosphogluconolactonase